ncbi:hypothetical protein Tco_0377639 [Tanacetum coccineum]
MRIDPTKTQKEPTYQVVLDALVLTTCYPAFLITADVLEIYMQQFWFTINKKDSTHYRFKIDKKSYGIDMEVFREIFQICPRLPNQDFDELPSDEEIVSFIKELGHKGDIKSITEVDLTSSDFQELKFYRECSIRRRMFMHTAQDDSILGPMRFVSKADDFQLWGMFYKKNVDFRTASPSKKRTLVTVEEEEPELAKKVLPSKKFSRIQSTGVQIQDTLGVSVLKKKTPTKAERSKGIDLLSEAALLEEAQVKKILRRSHRETSIHKAGGLGDETRSTLGVPDELKGNGDEANEQGDDEDVLESDDDLEQAFDERTESDNLRTSDEEEETQDDEYVHTPKDYVPTNDETNDESNDVDEEEYDRIDKEFYGDVNVSLTDAEPTDEEKGDEEITDSGHFHTSPLLTILVSVIPEHIIVNPSKTVTTTSTTTIFSLLSSLLPSLQQLTPIPTPTTTEAITSTTIVPDSKTLTALHQRIADLEKDVKELKDVDNSTKVISTIQSEVPKAI